MLTGSHLAIRRFGGWMRWHNQNLPENDGWTPATETAELPLLPQFSFANLPINERKLVSLFTFPSLNQFPDTLSP